jgi:uncharacterized protein (DUF58 family)
MERFIDPKTLARVRDMPLVARTVADGFLHGIQQSHQRGVGIEFSQYRAYEPGDDPGRIDWKLFARSDRYFVREAERESEIGVWLVIDASQSMAQRSENGAWSKFDYARHLLAALAWIAQRQGDLTGLLSLSSTQSEILPPATGERHWHRILRQLHGLETGNRFPSLDQVHSHMSRLQAPGLIILVSDFYQSSDEIYSFVRRVSTTRNEVLALQLQCQDEIDFPWRGPIRFEDLETGETALVSGASAREAWFKELEHYQSRIRKALGQINTHLHTINIDQPMDEALFAFLDQRRKLR